MKNLEILPKFLSSKNTAHSQKASFASPKQLMMKEAFQKILQRENKFSKDRSRSLAVNRHGGIHSHKGLEKNVGGVADGGREALLGLFKQKNPFRNELVKAHRYSTEHIADEKSSKLAPIKDLYPKGKDFDSAFPPPPSSSSDPAVRPFIDKSEVALGKAHQKKAPALFGERIYLGRETKRAGGEGQKTFLMPKRPHGASRLENSLNSSKKIWRASFPEVVKLKNVESLATPSKGLETARRELFHGKVSGKKTSSFEKNQIIPKERGGQKRRVLDKLIFKNELESNSDLSKAHLFKAKFSPELGGAKKWRNHQKTRPFDVNERDIDGRVFDRRETQGVMKGIENRDDSLKLSQRRDTHRGEDRELSASSFSSSPALLREDDSTELKELFEANKSPIFHRWFEKSMDSSISFHRMGDFHTADTEKLVEKISNYIIQRSFGSTSEVDLKVNHHELGHFRINAFKDLDHPGIKLTIMVYSKEGAEFFSTNQMKILSSLSQGGIQIQDFKLEQQLNNEQSYQSLSKENNSQEHSNARQDFDKRRELWKQFAKGRN